MNKIICMFIDADGKIKYVPNKFRVESADVIIADYSIDTSLNKNIIYYNNDLELDETKGDACWTSCEVIRRVEELKPNEVKIFTLVDDFLDYANEIQFAFNSNSFGDDFDEQIDVEEFKKTCANFDKEFIGTVDGIYFYRYKRREQ